MEDSVLGPSECRSRRRAPPPTTRRNSGGSWVVKVAMLALVKPRGTLFPRQGLTGRQESSYLDFFGPAAPFAPRSVVNIGSSVAKCFNDRN